MGEIRNIFKIAGIYVATIIGAGFASGQEIVQFFSQYEGEGFWGIFLTGLLFSLLGFLILNRVYEERIQDFDEILFPAVGWLMGWVIEIAVTLFMFAVFCIMVAGAGNILSDQFGISFHIGILVMLIFCCSALLYDIKGLIFLSSFLAPILIIGLLAIGFFIIASQNNHVFNGSVGLTKPTDHWFLSAILYVGYNSIISIVVLSSLNSQLRTKRAAILGGILGGLTLCVIALILNFIMFRLHPEAMMLEIPILSITDLYSSSIRNIYAFILLLAMLVSALTSGYGFIGRVHRKLKVHKKWMAILLCFFVFPISNLGFSNLISKIYPFFGYVGLFMITVILLQSFQRKSNFKGKL